MAAATETVPTVGGENLSCYSIMYVRCWKACLKRPRHTGGYGRWVVALPVVLCIERRCETGEPAGSLLSSSAQCPRYLAAGERWS